jgi:hypothetical protein
VLPPIAWRRAACGRRRAQIVETMVRGALELDFNHGFNHAGFRLSPTRKFRNRVGKRGTMGNPWGGVNPDGFDEVNDAGEVLRARISAGQKGKFTPVEVWIVERDLTREQPDKGQTAAIGRVFKRAHHRFGIAGGVKNRSRQIA